MNFFDKRIRSFAGIAMIALSSGAVAQTSDCDDTPAGQVAVGTTCNPVAFNSTNNTDYWDDAFFNGFCNEDDLDDAWMWFDATSTSTTITYTPAANDAILTIFQGTCSTTMSSIACSDVAGAAGAESVTIATVPGVRYHIRIQRYNSNNSMNGTVCVYGTGGGGGGATTASDCAVATNICTNLSFQIDPNGYGTIDEIPAPGSVSNPDVNPYSPNFGCLLVGEYNSTWMIVNIATSGNLEFVFGGLGAQAGYFDWIMYPYTGAASCTGILNNTLVPVRCNWNNVSYGGTGVSDVVPAGGDAGNFEPPLPVLAGQRYIICFSNYSNLATTVPLDFITGVGNADVSCTPLGFSMEGLAVECFPDFRELSWVAPMQNTVDKFVVEKSRDNATWELVGTVYTGTEDNGKLKYTLIDEADPTNLEYYRVKQYQNDGSVLPSNVISADCDNERDLFRVYPNPNTGIMSLEYESASDAQLEFFDVYGNLVYSELLERAMKSKTVQIRATGVPKGMYFYRLTIDSGVKSGTVIIQE